MKSLCDEETCACCFEFYCFDSHNNLSKIQLLQITIICQKQRHYFANKVLLVRAMVFPSGHVWM